MPNGVAVNGGFMANDTIGDVRSFAQHFFKENRYESHFIVNGNPFEKILFH